MVVHEGAGEDLREQVLLEESWDARDRSFISGGDDLLGLPPRLLRLPATLEHRG